MCLSLVAKRELKMERGKALVPCGKWKMFLKCFFEAHVRKEISKLQTSDSYFESITDLRLQDLKSEVLELVKLSSSSTNSSATIIIANDMDRLKSRFPPCMLFLYKKLKATNRLTHNARFNFSLFLKDIGMPLNESIIFWEHEYSKPSKCGKCSHSWQKNSGKYIYGIRHMYGLEGRRGNYSLPPCSRLQVRNNIIPLFTKFDSVISEGKIVIIILYDL